MDGCCAALRIALASHLHFSSDFLACQNRQQLRKHLCVGMFCLAVTAFAVLAPLAAASEAMDNATGVPTEANHVNATLSAWNETGAQLQLALATVDGQLIPLAGIEWINCAHIFPSSHFCISHHSRDLMPYAQLLPPYS